MEKTQKIKFIISLTFAAIFFIALPATAKAATLYFSPSTGEYAVNSTLPVSIYASSADQTMNAASGIISFPQDKLEVASISKSSSIFTLWVQEPSFSNSAGTVNFEGILLNPGFTGANGKVITVNFRVKAAGAATLKFSSGSALANDGKGTNILASLGNAQFRLGEPRSQGTPVELAGTPSAPEISSLTHPDPAKWYPLNTAKFTWALSSDTTGVRVLAERIPNAVPTVTYIPAISSKELYDLEDGIWYFSVRLRNDAGWGAISRFRFQIDTKKLNRFEITETPRKDLTEPRAKFIFDAKDETSGIDHYEIQIDNENPQIWQDDGSHRYETPISEPGKHILVAKAVDMAGNSLRNSAEFVIESLEAPAITDWPRELQSGEQLTVKGTTRYPNIRVVVWLQRENNDVESQTTKSDGKGNFVFTAEEKPKDGIYKFWAEVVDARGAKSLQTEKLTIAARRPAFLQIVSWTANLLAVMAPLVALAISLLFVVWYGWHKFSMFRKKFTKEVREAKSALRKTFTFLKNDIRKQIKMLEKTKKKRELTKEEKKVVRQLKKDLCDAEKFVKKKLRILKER